MRDYRNYRAEDPEVRRLLDRPRWHEWIEFECEHLNRVTVTGSGLRSDWSLADFKPEALEWDYYQDAVLKGGHEITELVSRMAERLPAEYHRYLHAGLTSSNVIDSCNHRRWERLSALHDRAATGLLSACDEELPRTPVPGCTHGRLAHRTDLHHRAFAGYPGSMQAYLSPLVSGGPTGWPGTRHRQAVPRHAYWIMWTWLARRSAWVEQMANDYRFYCSDLGGATGVTADLREAAVGSSSMPGKLNPTAFERVLSVGHLIRSTVTSQLMLPPQWLDRDLVHSAHERQTLDRLWDWSHWQLEEMTRLVRAVRLTATSATVQWDDSFTMMHRYLDQGMSWSEARAAAGKHPTG